MSLRFLFFTLLTALMMGGQPVSAQKKKSTTTQQAAPSVDNLKKEKQQTAANIKATSRKLDDNAKQTKRNLSRLETLRGQIEGNRRTISDMQTRADSIDSKMQRLNDTISTLESRLIELQASYANALRRLQSTTDHRNEMAWVLASGSFDQAWRRVRYLRQFSKWRSRKANEVERARDQLATKRDRLTELQAKHSDAMQRLELAQRQLDSQQQQTETLVASLKREEQSLRNELAQQQKRQKALDNQIDQLIRAEQERQERARQEKARKEAEARKREEATAKSAATADGTAPAPKPAPKPAPAPKPSVMPAADEKLTGSFAGNKGRLLFPVTSRYTIVRPFGLQQHPELKHVTTDNSGIDIEVAKGTHARVVFDGTVSAIFKQDGFQTIVMVRHGDYLTIYAGLGSISVKNGQSLKAGQDVGTIYTDPDDDNRTILHFELRKEREKLNPSHWLKQ